MEPFFVIRSIPETYSYVKETRDSVSTFGPVISIPCTKISEFYSSDYLFRIIRNYNLKDKTVIIISAGMKNTSNYFPSIKEYGYASEKRSSYISSTVLMFKMHEYSLLIGRTKLHILSSQPAVYYPNIIFTWNLDALKILNYVERIFFKPIILKDIEKRAFKSSLKSTSPDYIPLHHRVPFRDNQYYCLTQSDPEYYNHPKSENLVSQSLQESHKDQTIIPTHDYIYYYYLIQHTLSKKEKETFIRTVQRKTKSKYYHIWCQYQLATLKEDQRNFFIHKRQELEHLIDIFLWTRNCSFLSDFELYLRIPIIRHRFRELIGYKYSIAPLVISKNIVLVDKLLLYSEYKNLIFEERFHDLQLGYAYPIPSIKDIRFMHIIDRMECTKQYILCISGTNYTLIDKNFNCIDSYTINKSSEDKIISTYSLQNGLLLNSSKPLLNSKHYNFSYFNISCSYSYDKGGCVLLQCEFTNLYRFLQIQNKQIIKISPPLKFNIIGDPHSICFSDESFFITTNKSYLYHFKQ